MLISHRLYGLEVPSLMKWRGDLGVRMIDITSHLKRSPSLVMNDVYFRFVPQTHFQPSFNPLNNAAPSKWLTPTPRKSYKMFFQMVTHSLPTSNIIFIGRLSCPLPLL